MAKIEDIDYKITVSSDLGQTWEEVEIPEPTEYRKGIWPQFYWCARYDFKQEMHWNRYNEGIILNRIRLKYWPSLCVWWALWKVRNVFLWIRLRFNAD